MLCAGSTTLASELESTAPPRTYRFGMVEVDFHAGELRRAGLRIHMQDQPLQVLSILLRHPGETVSREEFRKSLWPADTFVDFDHGLNSAMKRLRDALDDDPDRPRFVETIPRHGYRFIAPVTNATIPEVRHAVTADWARAEQTPPGLAAEPAATTKHTPQDNIEHPRPASPWRPALIAPAIGALVLVAAAVVMVLVPRVQPRSGPYPRVVLAVLPFRHLTAVPAQGFVAEGMTQALITHLGKLDSEQIVVSARTPLNRDQNGKMSASDIASDPGVGYVLDGSTQLEGNHLRVSVQLIAVRDQSYVWTESYDETAADVLQAEASIATQISDAIRRKLGH